MNGRRCIFDIEAIAAPSLSALHPFSRIPHVEPRGVSAAWVRVRRVEGEGEEPRPICRAQTFNWMGYRSALHGATPGGAAPTGAPGNFPQPEMTVPAGAYQKGSREQFGDAVAKWRATDPRPGARQSRGHHGASHLQRGLQVRGACACAGPAERRASQGVRRTRKPDARTAGYGIYLGNGIVLTAAHVPSNVLETKPHVVIAGLDLPASLIKQGSLDEIDLTLLSVDAAKPNAGLRTAAVCGQSGRCGHSGGNSRVSRPFSGCGPKKPTRSLDTVIGDLATTGSSGAGVLDARMLCLLGIVSRKISVGPPGVGSGTKDIAKYFVPVQT